MWQQAMAGARQAQQNFMTAQHHIWQNQASVNQGIMQSFAYHNAAQDSAMHQWSNANFGVNDVINPDAGVVRRVDNRFDQYWATNDGTVIGRNWARSPIRHGITWSRSSCEYVAGKCRRVGKGSPRGLSLINRSPTRRAHVIGGTIRVGTAGRS
jgi:hypothetical protein